MSKEDIENIKMLKGSESFQNNFCENRIPVGFSDNLYIFLFTKEEVQNAVCFASDRLLSL